MGNYSLDRQYSVFFYFLFGFYTDLFDSLVQVIWQNKEFILAYLLYMIRIKIDLLNVDCLFEILESIDYATLN